MKNWPKWLKTLVILAIIVLAFVFTQPLWLRLSVKAALATGETTITHLTLTEEEYALSNIGSLVTLSGVIAPDAKKGVFSVGYRILAASFVYEWRGMDGIADLDYDGATMDGWNRLIDYALSHREYMHFVVGGKTWAEL
ncbi:MAG: hypothetical protein IKX91_03285 [Firmicutes bacterium]|nr:hypothetical protein [Bacillota bacterium]